MKNVIKTYSSKIAFDMELYMVKYLSEFDMAAKITSVKKNEIEFCEINGKTLYEVLENLNNGTIEFSEATTIFKQLMLWLDLFNEHTYKLHNTYLKLTDFHYKNFMFSNNKIYGIDFECYEKGKIEDNYISLLAWFKLYNFSNIRVIEKLFVYMLNKIQNKFSNINMLTMVNDEIDRILNRRLVKKTITDCTAVVVCGGKNTRMEGFEKANLKLGKYTFLQHIIYKLSNFDNLVISCNNEKQLNFEGQEIIVDKVENIGPIGGIYTALSNVTTNCIFVISCDFPTVNDIIINKMLIEYNKAKKTVIAKINGKINPLLGVYNKNKLDVIEKNISKGNYKLMCLFDDDTCFLEIGGLLCADYYNINTKQEYAQLINNLESFNNLPLTTY